jgi:hypothetical protein
MTLMDLCLHDGVKLRYPTCGESVQPLQSVKFIRIDVSAVSDELWFGFDNMRVSVILEMNGCLSCVVGTRVQQHLKEIMRLNSEAY